jgi:hypothetical protein
MARGVQQLIDRKAIHDCLLRFARGVDRRDPDLVRSAYHPDAMDDHGAMVGSAGDMIEWGRLRDRTGPVSTHHHITDHSCEVDGDSAHAETYYIFDGRNPDGTTWIAGGRYLDRLERRDGEWKIAFRYCLVEWAGGLPAGEMPFAAIPDVHLNGEPSRSRDDPSYRRPLVNRRPRRIPRA